MISRSLIPVVCAAGLLIAGCGKQEQNKPSATPAPAQNPASAQASGASASPGTAATGTGAAAAPAPSSPNATVEENAAKLSAIDWAMKQDEIKNDPNGQWAIDATASSSYNNATGRAAWSAQQTTGAPDVDRYGDNGNAWAPKTPDGGIEWLDLKYAKPIHASEIRIRESCGSGAVVKVEAFDEQGAAHKIWQGIDPTRELNYFIVKFPKTDYTVNRVKVTLATNVIPGWNEIDAVQLVGTESK